MSRMVVIRRLTTLAVTVLAMLALAAPAAFAEDLIVTTTDNPVAVDACDATQCTLREAITRANNNGQTDTIHFAGGVSGEIELNSTTGGFSIFNDNPAAEDLTIYGPGQGELAVDGNDQTRAFGIVSGANVTIRGLTIKDGKANGNENAGGIGNGGTLTLIDSTVSGNTAVNTAGGINNFFGTLTLDRSTVNGNRAATGGGIDFRVDRNLTIPQTTITTSTTSTISGNTATTLEGGGGGIHALEGITRIEHSTITRNTAPSGAGSGVAAVFHSRLYVLSTIISGNTNTDVDDNGDHIESEGYNLIGDGNATTAFNQSGDQTGVANPGLGPLANNGGPTWTHALLAGSPAIEAGSTACPPPEIGQRGVFRAYDSDGDGNLFCDTGAFEKTPPSIPTVLSTVPADGARNVDRDANISARFSKGMLKSSITTDTVRLYDGYLTNEQVDGICAVPPCEFHQKIAASVSYNAKKKRATLNPTDRLAANTTYTVVVEGQGDSDTLSVEDRAGNAMAISRIWHFTTGSS